MLEACKTVGGAMTGGGREMKVIKAFEALSLTLRVITSWTKRLPFKPIRKAVDSLLLHLYSSLQIEYEINDFCEYSTHYNYGQILIQAQ